MPAALVWAAFQYSSSSVLVSARNQRRFHDVTESRAGLRFSFSK